MATLSASNTFSIGAGSTVVEQVDITILSAPTAPTGPGRLVHPTLGTLDYEISPDSWGNIDSDAIIAPIWSSEMTLSSGINTVWAGHIKDVQVYENWGGALAMRAPQFRGMHDFYSSPPVPPSYVEWYPSYLNGLGFKVAITNLTSGGSAGMNSDFTVLQKEGFIKGPVRLTMKLIGYV